EFSYPTPADGVAVGLVATTGGEDGDREGKTRDEARTPMIDSHPVGVSKAIGVATKITHGTMTFWTKIFSSYRDNCTSHHLHMYSLGRLRDMHFLVWFHCTSNLPPLYPKRR